MPYDIDAIMRMNAEAAEQERQEVERQQREAVTAAQGKQIIQVPINELVDFPAEKHPGIRDHQSSDHPPTFRRTLSDHRRA